MKHQPFQFQTDLVLNTSRALAKNKAVITQAPPGAGKTLIAYMIIKRGIEKRKTFLVLTETTKIYKQLVAEFGSVEIDSDVKSLYVQQNKCYTAMSQTLIRRPVILEQFLRLGDNLIIIADECHLNTMTPILKHLPDAYKIGLSATPFYKWAKHLPEIYQDLVHGPQVEELIQLGRLCDYKHIARTRADLSLLELRNGEYSESSQEKVFTSKSVYDGLFEDLRTIKFNKAIIFVASKKAADALTERLQQESFAATRFHSSVPHAEYELAKFTQLHLCNILVTIRSLSKGWDYKPIDLVVLNHKTTSGCLYLQEIGRGSRVIPGVKEHFTCLDYGDNWKQHGLYFENRDFTKLWNQVPKKVKEKGVAPIKCCPKCEALVSSSIRICPYCKEEFPITKAELEMGELIEITQHYSQLAGRRLSELTPHELSIYIKTLNKKPFGARIARAREQKESGYLKDYAKHMGYKSSWVDFQMGMIGEEPIEYADLVIKESSNKAA